MNGSRANENGMMNQHHRVQGCGLYWEAANHIAIGTAYAVWTGIGAVGTAVYGMARLGESRAGRRIICLITIVAGVVVLRVTDPVAPVAGLGPPAEVDSNGR